MLRRALTMTIAVAFVASFVQLAGGSTVLAIDLQPTTTIYLPNITRMLGGADGWNTPFIVQNVGASSTNLTFDFRRFSDGAVVKTRTVTGLAPGTSVFHAPNADGELAAGGPNSAVIQPVRRPVVAAGNEHPNGANPPRHGAPSHDGLTSGAMRG